MTSPVTVRIAVPPWLILGVVAFQELGAGHWWVIVPDGRQSRGGSIVLVDPSQSFFGPILRPGCQIMLMLHPARGYIVTAANIDSPAPTESCTP